MSCNFSCFLSFTDAQKENDVGVFQSDSGDVFKVKYKSNVCRDLLLRIEWTIPKQILFTVKLYSTSFKRCFSSKGMVINGKKAFMKLRGAFNVSNSRNYKVLCVINLIPYIKFNDNNDLPPELFDNSGCIESEFQESSMDENNAVTYEEMRFGNENPDENRAIGCNAIVKINEINIPNKCENARPVNEMVHVSSAKSDFKLKNIAITDEMLIEESNMTTLENFASDTIKRLVPIINKDSLSSCDHNEKIMKNENVHTVCIQNSEDTIQTDAIYIQNSENRENGFTGNREDSLIRNSDKQNNESALANDTSPEENTVRSNSQDEILNTKILTVDDYSEEIIENIKTIHIHNNLELDDTFSENNSSMEVDFPEMSSESHSVLCDEDISLSDSDNKASEKFSTNIAPEKSPTGEVEFHALPKIKDIEYSQDEVKSVVNSEDMKVNFMLESNDISMNKNHQDEKHYGEKCLTNLSNCNIGSHISNSDISNVDNDVKPSILQSHSLPTDTQKSSEVIKIAEINDTAIVSHKSESAKLSSNTDLVFKTLVRKLSAADCDLQLTDVQEEVTSSSGRSLKRSPGSKTDNRKYFPIMESELKGLSMDMLDLLTSGDMADAEITNGEKHVKVHRAIVSARSSAFKKLFVKHNTDDINYRAVVDIPSYILEDIIVFLYVGLVYIKNTKMVQDLSQVAERYGINDLIDICSKHI